ncbi:HK97 family phage prohead protease [Haematobacter genomosp. 1]|uniref:Peptidase U35 n=1 Tax=Haematobacter genomosp. 1 TaxID=366618 RepID=A0A212ADA6_9RHOB|nr:HK97 family phage prohead protease [Haematobacter genomosp. 1]OWJ78948.1 peptidase U35 [Haematobacter genomosp. 1]
MQAEGELERKFAVPGALTVTDGTRIEGYASVFGVRDRGGDVVMPGAYGASLARMAAAGRRVKLLWQHDAAQPIGVWDEIVEDAHGLRVKGRLLTEVGRGREAAALLEAGAIDGLSIGYRTLRSDRGPEGERRLHALDLWEVSLVTFPMLPEARVAQKAAETDMASLFTRMTGEMRAARTRLASSGTTITRRNE